MEHAREALTKMRARAMGPREVFQAACRDIIEHIGSTRASSVIAPNVQTHPGDGLCFKAARIAA